MTAADGILTDAQRDTLLRYASDTWAGVRRHDRSRDRPARRQPRRPTARRASRRRRRTSAPTCGARSSPRRSASSTTPRPSSASSRRSATLETMERHKPSGQYYNWYDHTTGAKLTGWPPTGDAAHPDPVVGRQRLAGDRPAVVSNTVPEVVGSGRRRCSTAWTSASTTGPRSTGSPSTSRPTPGASPCCYDTIVSESRIASYIGIAKGELPREGVLRRLADVPRHLRLELAGDEAGRLRRHVPRRRTSSRAPTRTRTSASCPGWGGSMFEALMPALFVPEEQWAPAQLGDQPPADDHGPDPPRPRRGGVRLLGLLAGQRPRRRLHRVRRRRDRA